MSAASEVSPRSLPQQGFQAVRLADRLGSRDNNFDLLRLLAAWSVLVSHSFALLGQRRAAPPVRHLARQPRRADLLRGQRAADPPQLGVRPVAARLLGQAWAAPAARAGDGVDADGLRDRPAGDHPAAGRLLLLGRDLDLPRPGDPALPLRRRPARGLRGQPVRRRGQRPALEPAASRSSPISCCSSSASPGCWRDEAFVVAGRRRRRSPGPRSGCPSPPTPSARSTCSPPSRSAPRRTPSPTASCWPGRSRLLLLPVCVAAGLGPDLAARGRVDAGGGLPVVLVRLRPAADRPGGHPVRRRVVRRLHLGVPDPAGCWCRRSPSLGPWGVIALATPIVRALAMRPGTSSSTRPAPQAALVRATCGADASSPRSVRMGGAVRGAPRSRPPWRSSLPVAPSAGSPGTVLVTGGAGFIGCALAERLAAVGRPLGRRRQPAPAGARVADPARGAARDGRAGRRAT